MIGQWVWNSFEAEVKKYVESFGKEVAQQQATFKLQAAAQLKAWREAADKLGGDAKEFATERHVEIDAAIKRMKADAAVAEEKIQKNLNQAGAQSWSAFASASRRVVEKTTENTMPVAGSLGQASRSSP